MYDRARLKQGGRSGFLDLAFLNVRCTRPNFVFPPLQLHILGSALLHSGRLSRAVMKAYPLAVFQNGILNFSHFARAKNCVIQFCGERCFGLHMFTSLHVCFAVMLFFPHVSPGEFSLRVIRTRASFIRRRCSLSWTFYVHREQGPRGNWHN